MALNRSKLKATELAFVDTNNIEYVVHDFERQGLVARTKDQLKSALSKLGSNKGTICIVDTIDIDEDLTIPENISLKFFNGGILNVLTQDIPDENVGTGDGSTTEFSLAYSPVLENSETIYVDGTEQTRNTDYTINYETGIITFTSAPANGASITADYTRRFKLTINGGIDAGLFQIFSGDGVVTGNPKIEVVYPEWFGAKGDGVTDDIRAMQKAVNMSHTLLPVELSAKTYIVSEPIIIDTTQVIRGKGKYLSVIKAADGSNIDVIKTKNFNSLTGQNKWFTSEGVVYGFELSHFQIDGNRDNQTSGNGIKIYGKGYRIDEVLIKNIKDVGFYSETGVIGGQNDETDLPECIIGSLWIKNTGKDGFIYRGPHDGTIKHLVVADTGLDDDTTNGVSFQYLADTYNGSCDIDFIHEYSSRGDGIYIDTSIKANLLIGESNWGAGIVFSESNGNYCEISKIESYANDRANSHTRYNVEINGNFNIISLLKIDKNKYDALGGLLITGYSNEIYGMYNRGHSSTGIGIKVEHNYNKISGRIWGYTGEGSIGLQTADTGVSQCYFDLRITDVFQIFDIYLTEDNYLNINGWNDPNITNFGTISFLNPSLIKSNDLNLRINIGGIILSKNSGTVTIPAGDTSVVVEHKLFTSPTTITLGQNSNLNGADLWVGSITSSSFTIYISSAQTSDTYIKWYAEV